MVRHRDTCLELIKKTLLGVYISVTMHQEIEHYGKYVKQAIHLIASHLWDPIPPPAAPGSLL